MSTPSSHASRTRIVSSRAPLGLRALALAAVLVAGLGGMQARADTLPDSSAAPPASSAPGAQAPTISPTASPWVAPPAPSYGPPGTLYPAAPVVQWQPPPPPPAPFSVPRRTTGQVLTVLGIAHGLAATIVEGMFGFYSFVVSGPLHVSGAVLTSVGVPLWMSGSKLVQNGRPITAGIDVGHGVTMSPRAGGFELSF